MRAGICDLATGDSVDAERALIEFGKLDASFVTQQEYELLRGINEAMRSRDRPMFRQIVEQFCHANTLQDWKATILSVAEDRIEEDEFARDFWL